MSSSNFIIKGLDQLVKAFPLVKLSYQFDDTTDTHFVEVLPKGFFEKYDKEFVSSENDLILSFIKTYPNEGLAFITQDDFFEVTSPCYIATGELFERLNSVRWSGIELREMLRTHEADIKTVFTFDHNMPVKSQLPAKYEFTFESVDEMQDTDVVTNSLPTTVLNSTDLDYDDPNLMLAA